MLDLFAKYHTIMIRKGLTRIITGYEKVSVISIRFSIQLQFLKESLASDFSSWHKHLERHMKRFLSYKIELANAFPLVDCSREKAAQIDVNECDTKRTGRTEHDTSPWNRLKRTKLRPKGMSAKRRDWSAFGNRTKVSLLVTYLTIAEGAHEMGKANSCRLMQTTRLKRVLLTLHERRHLAS